MTWFNGVLYVFGGLSSLLANFLGDGIISYHNRLRSKDLSWVWQSAIVILMIWYYHVSCVNPVEKIELLSKLWNKDISIHVMKTLFPSLWCCSQWRQNQSLWIYWSTCPLPLPVTNKHPIITTDWDLESPNKPDNLSFLAIRCLIAQFGNVRSFSVMTRLSMYDWSHVTSKSGVGQKKNAAGHLLLRSENFANLYIYICIWMLTQWTMTSPYLSYADTSRHIVTVCLI